MRKEFHLANKKIQSCSRRGRRDLGTFLSTCLRQPSRLRNCRASRPCPGSAGAFADRYGVETVFDTVDQLFAKEVPDIVSIILPVGHNPETVIACAEAGVKAVSCEKPIAVELSQADEMVRVCRERGTAFGCGTGYWDAPYLQEIADWIRAGNIGQLTGAAIPPADCQQRYRVAGVFS